MMITATTTSAAARLKGDASLGVRAYSARSGAATGAAILFSSRLQLGASHAVVVRS